MTGGMLAWDGRAATGPVDAGRELIRDRTSPDQLVMMAWALEEGAGRFYRGVADRATGERERTQFLALAAAEDGHKKKVMDAWRAVAGEAPAMDPGEQGLPGIMEGGYSVSETLDFLRSRSSREILEVAMQIETNSLDLYLKIMRWTEHASVKEIFSQLVAEEKKHLEGLGGLLEEL